MIIFLFIKKLYYKDIRQQVADTKAINTLADAFKIAHHSLLKLKKYKGLVYEGKHKGTEINQFRDTSKNISGCSSDSKLPDKGILNMTNRNYT